MSSGQIDVNRFWEEVRRSLSQHISGLEEEFKSEQRQREQDLSFLARFAHDVLQKETQDEILTTLLEGAHRFAPRVVLFIARGDKFMGWSSRGYTEATARQITQSSLHQTESRLLMGALTADGLHSASDVSLESVLQGLMQNEASPPWHTFPLKAIGRPVAVLLAAPEVGQSCNLEALSIIMDITGLRIENLALRVLPEIAAATTAMAPARPYAPPLQEAGVRAAPAVVEEQPEEVAAEAAHVDTAVSAAAAEAAPLVAAAQKQAAAEVVSEPAMSAPGVVEEVPREAPEEDKLHAEAKRFARLLVSEIKLYNEQRVAEGRKSKDLYQRLKRDIDRSRDMYEKRVAPAVQRTADHFHNELVRILGDNDPSALGVDYPGPRVES